MNIAACATVAPRKTTNRGSAAVTMNCWSIAPTANPTIDFDNPPMPITPIESASCVSPGQASRQHPGNRPARQRHVHDDDQDQIDGCGSPDQESRQARL